MNEDDIITFRRDRLYELLGRIGLPPGLWGEEADKFLAGVEAWRKIDCATLAPLIIRLVEEYRER